MKQNFTILIFLLIAFGTNAQTIWTGNVDNNYTNAANWTLGLPVTGGTATIPATPAGAFFPTITTPVTIDYTLTNDGSLNNFSTISNSAIIENSGNINNFGAGNIINTTTGTFSNNSSGFINTAATITNDGDFINDGNILNCSMLINNGEFLNNGFINSNGGTLKNTGNFQNIGNLRINAMLINSGTITNDGNINVTALAALDNSGLITNNFILDNAGNITNTGTLINTFVLTNNFGATITNDGNGQIINASCATFRQFTANPITCGAGAGANCGLVNAGIIYLISGAGSIDNLSGQGIVLNDINSFPSPDVQCQDLTLQLDADGLAVIDPSSIDNGSTADYCFIDSIWISKDTFDCSNLGANTVTLFVQDGLGQTAFCTANVTIEDDRAPQLNCSNDITITLDPGDCEAFVVFPTPTATDNCNIGTITRTDATGLNSGDPFPIGTTTIAYEVSDGTNTSTCSFNIVILDYPNPIGSLSCNSNGVQISLDPDCEATIGADDILEGGPYRCYDSYIVELFFDAQMNQPVPTSPVVTASNINQTLYAKVLDPINGNSCWGTVFIEDKHIPELACTTYEFACTQSTIPTMGGTPGFPLAPPAFPFQNSTQSGTTQYSLVNFDGCGDALLSYSDWIEDIDCRIEPGNPYTKIIYRTWTVTDEQGNSTQCEDTLRLLRATITDILPPANYDDVDQAALLCEDQETAPANSFCGSVVGWNSIDPGDFAGDLYVGHPSPYDENYPCGNTKWLGTGVPQGADCGNINFTFEDTRVNVCSTGDSEGCYKVLRLWTILDWCTGDFTTLNQLIKVADKEGPTITDIEDVTISTDAWSCEANWYLPEPWIMDNCSEIDGLYTVTATAGTVDYITSIGRYQITGLPLGVHQVKVRAEDCCSNATEKTIEVTVQDLVPPNVVCEVFHTASLTIDGTVKIDAHSLDDGSNDACGPVYFKTIRMEDLLGTDHGSNSNQGLTDCDLLNGDDSNKFGNQIFFDDFAKFCCEDVDHNNTLILRVFDVDPGSGPVDPNRMRSGGDLAGHFNDCMVEMTINDYLAPFISCPSDITVDCEFWFDRNDLGSTFGTVRDNAAEVEYIVINGVTVGTDGVAADNCGVTISENVVDNLNCGQGTITRIFTATDIDGRTASCVQRITIEDNDPYYINDTNCFNFDPNDGVRWPCDYSAASCGADTDPSVSGEPQIFNDDNCALITVTYNDEDFPVVPDACFKIKRIWTITDWCVFDEFDSDNNDVYDPTDDGIIAGQWEYVQFINVLNSSEPVFGNCENIEICGYNTDCTGNAALTNTIVDDCTPGALVILDFKIDADNDGTFDFVGANVSPYPYPNPMGLPILPVTYEDTDADGTYEITINAVDYPIGTHRILWSAEDACSNKGTCEYLFEIKDCAKPTPKAFNGLAVDIQPVTEQVLVTAMMLDAGSFDNCGVEEWRLAHPSGGPGQTIPPSTTEVIFGCNDLGLRPVDLWVKDIYGNWDYVSTYVDVQNNMGACSTIAEANISGAVHTEVGEAVENVMVNLDGNVPGIPDFYLTQTTGDYHFDNLPSSYDYTLTPSRDDDIRNGISTLDLIQISRHLIGLAPIPSPYRRIAADVDNNGNINTFDIIALQKVLLFLSNDFPNNTSWRFVDADHVFDPSGDPFSSSFPELLNFDDLSADVIGDFVGIKVGDVSGDAKANNATGSNGSSRNLRVMELVLEEAVLDKEQEHTVQFTTHDFIEMMGYQFTLGFDPAAIEFLDIQVGNIKGLTKDNFGLLTLDEGMITTNWASTQAMNLENGTHLFSLTFRAKRQVVLSEVLEVNSRYTRAEAYAKNLWSGTGNLDILDIGLRFNGDAETILAQQKTNLLQNQPNPFMDHTLVGFTLAEKGPATLTIFSASGVELKKVDQIFDKGYNEVLVKREELGAGGVFIYQLVQGGRKKVKKMVMLE